MNEGNELPSACVEAKFARKTAKYTCDASSIVMTDRKEWQTNLM